MDAPILSLSGIGKARAAALEKLGICKVGDLLQLYPRRYEDRSMVLPIEELTLHMGEKVSLIARVRSVPKEQRIYGGRLITSVVVEDDTGALTLTYFNNPYIKQKLKVGKTYNFYGRMDHKRLLQMIAPVVAELKEGEQPGILPIYPLAKGLNQTLLRRLTKEALERFGGIEDPLPEKLLEKYQLAGLGAALKFVHQPRNQAEILMGRRRLIFEELLYFQLGLGLYSRREKDQNCAPITKWDQGYRALHSFSPTPSQERAIQEILADMQGEYAMNRLLQGDVGSGKTFVAGEAAYGALKSGYQVAIMAPTEILARQHAAYFQPLMEALGYKTDLLVGSLTAKEKRAVYARAEAGEARLLIGTHALVQKGLQFENLGLVIADEQHRFGVRQRAALASKGRKPHVLVMSATPIPRTMALMVWGDLDLSVLDGRPAGRKEIKTYLVDESYRARLMAFMEKEIGSGGQVYIVCPLVEENEEMDLRSAQQLFASLQERYGERVALIHGKMKPALKDQAMARFVAGECDILVSTTVIEVGINVPSASLMILENAERFGLSQLHQLRGRVGRGERQSYCILVSKSENEKTLERLKFFCSTTDGFEISNKDLELRGPGDFFGEMQHGLPRMQIADCATDLELLTLSNSCAKRMLSFDPLLEKDYNQKIREKVDSLFEREGTIFN